MRVFLRHVRTGHYFRGDSEWAMAEADAVDFGTIERAVEVVAGERLDGMSVVVRHDDSGAEQVFDLTDRPVRSPGVERET